MTIFGKINSICKLNLKLFFYQLYSSFVPLDVLKIMILNRKTAIRVLSVRISPIRLRVQSQATYSSLSLPTPKDLESNWNKTAPSFALWFRKHLLENGASFTPM